MIQKYTILHLAPSPAMRLSPRYHMRDRKAYSRFCGGDASGSLGFHASLSVVEVLAFGRSNSYLALKLLQRDSFLSAFAQLRQIKAISQAISQAKRLECETRDLSFETHSSTFNAVREKKNQGQKMLDMKLRFFVCLNEKKRHGDGERGM